MKKKILMTIMTFALCFSCFSGLSMESKAEDMTQSEDYSYLLTDDAIIGQMQVQPRGVYLASGISVIQDAGTGKIVAGGITSAAQQCKVTLNVVVERLTGGNWVRVTSWVAEENNAWTVGSSKTMSVGRGYYYRVRCQHSANSVVSGSMTSSLWR